MSSYRIDRRGFIGGSLGAGALFSARFAFGQDRSAYPPPDQELMARVTGGRVYVRVNGRLDGARPPIVMIHGGPGATHTSLLNLLPLSEDRAVVIYDQLDSGFSDHPGDPANWTVERFTNEVDAVRRALGVSRWHVLGHSWGGTIALEYGARRPVELAGLVLASPLVSTRAWIADANTLRAQLPPNVQTTLSRCDPPAPITSACEQATEVFYNNYFTRRPRPEAYKAYMAAHPTLRTNERLYQTMWGSSEFVSTGTLRTYDGERLLAKLKGRQTLFIDGQYDEARPATIAKFAAQANDAEFAVIPGSGHAFFSDNPDEALGVLRPWLRQQDRL